MGGDAGTSRATSSSPWCATARSGDASSCATRPRTRPARPGAQLTPSARPPRSSSTTRRSVDKVESIVFRNHDLPKGQININAENGVVFLRGQVEPAGARGGARERGAQGARREGRGEPPPHARGRASAGLAGGATPREASEQARDSTSGTAGPASEVSCRESVDAKRWALPGQAHRPEREEEAVGARRRGMTAIEELLHLDPTSVVARSPRKRLSGRAAR